MVLSYRPVARARLCRLLTIACLLLTAARVWAQPEAQPPDADNAAEALTETPRAALTRFFELARRGDYPEAAKFLELPSELDAARGPELAKRLKLVLDHHKWLDLSKVSAAASGNLNDGLSSAVEEIARVPLGLTQPLKATGMFSDATTLDLTGQVAWASDSAEKVDPALLDRLSASRCPAPITGISRFALTRSPA